MAFKTDFTAISTTLAAIGSIMFAVGIWFVFTRFLNMDAGLAALIAGLIGGIEYFTLRYIFSQKYTAPSDDL